MSHYKAEGHRSTTAASQTGSGVSSQSSSASSLTKPCLQTNPPSKDPVREKGPDGAEGGEPEVERWRESAGSSSGSGEDTDWKERCETLEASLHKFKQQALRIRELLAQKMQDLERRTEEAERKSQLAEVRAAELEQQLASMDASPEDQRCLHLAAKCQNKDKVLWELRQSLEQQKQLRFEEGRKIEERTSTIKDWVAKKVKKLECENSQLKLDNDNLTHQVETLRLRLQLLPVSAAREIHRLSIQGSDDESLYACSSSCASSSTQPSVAPPVPRRPASAVMETFHREQNLSDPSVPSPEFSPDLDDNLAALCDDFEPDYQEVDDHRESKYAPSSALPQRVFPTSVVPPSVRIERRVFPPNPLQCRASVRSSGEHFFQDGGEEGTNSVVMAANPHQLSSPSNENYKVDWLDGSNQPLDENDFRKITRAEGQKCFGNSGHFAEDVGSYGRSADGKSQNHKSSRKSSRKKVENMKKPCEDSDLSPEYAEPPPPPINSPFLRAPALLSPTGDPKSPPQRQLKSPPQGQLKSPPQRQLKSIKEKGASLEKPGLTTNAYNDQILHSSITSSQKPPETTYTGRLGYNSRNIPAFATMPRRKRSQFNTDKNSGSSSKETYDTLPTGFTRSYSERRPKPPTPPLRRLPSWENRIYAVANVGLQLPEAGNESVMRHSGIAVTEDLYGGGVGHMYKDLCVPVYTTLKGCATRIRSMPFTGESSSDSDDPASGVVMATSSESEAVVVSVAGPSGGRAGVNPVSAPPGGGRGDRHVGQSSTGAVKRGVCATSPSVTSESSSDYALPPEEFSLKQESSEDSEPQHKLLKYTKAGSGGGGTSRGEKSGILERSGYLTKLGGKVKSWRQRWFVLKGSQLFYYKSPNDVAKRPQGFITMDKHSKVLKCDGAFTFQISTVKKAYYLTAASADDMDQWIKVLQGVLRRQTAEHTLGSHLGQESVKGWLIKGKNGRRRRCYGVVAGRHLLYYRSPADKTPLGQVPLQGAHVEEVDRSCDTENSDSEDTALPDYTLVIWAKNRLPTYLMVPTKQEKDTWLYHLSLASGGHLGMVGTEFEQIVSKLVEAEGDPSSSYWKNASLLHTRELLPRPLTTLPSEGLQTRALQLFKSCQMFINMSIESSQIDDHVTLAQNILNTCLQIRELQNELYCQLLKQATWHPPQPRSTVQTLLCGSHSWLLCSDHSPTSVAADNSASEMLDSKQNPAPYVFIQTWQLLAMATSLFLPSQSVLWYLKAHLQRHADHRTEIGKYAIFCQRAVERVRASSPRDARPSRMEVMSILLRNPYHHSQPISIPVHFINGTYQVVSFDGSTTVDEFLHTLTRSVSMRDGRYSGFALFTDDPAGQPMEHCLRGNLQICDVISKWEQAFLHHATQRSGKVDINRTVRFTYKNSLYFRSQLAEETPKERLLLCHQWNIEVCEGRFPLNRELALELCVLMAQIELGDQVTAMKSAPRDIPSHSSEHPATVTVLDRFYPDRYRDTDMAQNRTTTRQEIEETISICSDLISKGTLESRVLEKWRALQGRSAEDCVRIYLNVVRKWPFCGARMFYVQVKFAEAGTGQAWLAVQEGGVAILEPTSLKCLSYFTFQEVVTFGGCHDDMMLVVSRHGDDKKKGAPRKKTERLLFEMSKPKMLEFTMVMASYINNGTHLPWQPHQEAVVTNSDAVADCHFYCDVPSYRSSDVYVSSSVRV